MPKIRTIREAVLEIKNSDPNSCLTENALRRFILEGRVPCVKVGGKYLVNQDTLDQFLCGELLQVTNINQIGFGGVRKAD